MSTRGLLAASATALCVVSSPVAADVTAQDVWDSWMTYMKNFGYVVTAETETSSSALMVSDVRMTLDLPEDEGRIDVRFPSMDFVENGDGTVDIQIPATAPVDVMYSGDGEDVKAVLMMGNEGLSTTVSGTPEDMSFAYSAAKLTMDVTELEVDGERPDDFEIAMVVASLAGTSNVAVTDAVEGRDTIIADSVELTVKGSDPDTGDSLDMVAQMTGLRAETTGLMSFADLTTPEGLSALPENYSAKTVLKSATITAAFVDDEGPGTFSATTGEGSGDVAITEGTMAYAGSIADFAVSIISPEMPLPVDFSFGKIGYDLTMPLLAMAEPQDFAFGLNFTDIALSEVIWGMFDPGQVLPRDPATLILNLTGLGTLTQDLMTVDEDADIPGEINALSINEMELSAAGASLTGSGDFTFDNSDLESFDGMPRPEGVLNIDIAGVNGLMDKLIAMGLLPEDQAMGARMMLSMFSIPGEGEDTLTSTIEVNEQGHVLANGQRLR